MSRLTTDQNHWPVTTISLPIVQQCAHVAEYKSNSSLAWLRSNCELTHYHQLDNSSHRIWSVPDHIWANISNILFRNNFVGLRLGPAYPEIASYRLFWSVEDLVWGHHSFILQFAFQNQIYALVLVGVELLMAYFALVLNLTVINSGLHFKLLYKRRLETFCLDNPSHRLWLVSDLILPKGKCLSYDNLLESALSSLQFNAWYI